MAIVTTNFQTNVIDLVNSLSSADKANLNESIFKSLFVESDFAKERKIMPGVRNGGKLVELDNSTNYNSFPAQTGCADNECDLNIDGDTYNWLIGNYNCKIPICLKTFNQDFLTFFNTWSTDNDEDGLTSALVQYLFNQFKKNANGALWAKSFVAQDGSGNPVLEDSNGHLVLGEAGGGEVIAMAENTAGSESLTFADENVVKGYLDQAYEYYLGSEFYEKDVVIEMDRRSAMNYIQWLDANDTAAAGCCVDIEKVMTNKRGFTGLNYRGIPIKVRSEYDKTSAQVLAGAKPHFILLVEQSKLLIGTEQINKLADFDLWYSKDANQIYMRGELNMGAALPTKDYVLIY